MVLEEAQTQIKIIIKNSIFGKPGYATFLSIKARINKTISDAIRELESKDLKIIAKASLERFAEKLIGQSLVAIGVPTSSIILYYGLFKSGMTMPSISKQVKSQIQGQKAENVDQRTYDIGQAAQTYSKEYFEKVKPALEQIIRSEPEYEKNVSLRNIAEMTVRYEKTLGSIEDLKARGINLVQSSQHANCSKRCEPWQGKYYTLDDTYQVVDGIQFQPLSNATDQYYVTKKGKVYKNGHITGYNCRHYLVPYKKGKTQPMVSAETVAKERAIDSRMRQMERQIRLWKDTALIYKGENQELYQKAMLKAKTYDKKYMDFAKANKRAFYPSRTDVF